MPLIKDNLKKFTLKNRQRLACDSFFWESVLFSYCLGKEGNLKYSLCPFGTINLKSWLPGVLLFLFGIKWSSHFPSRKPQHILYITDSLVCLLMYVSSVSHFKGTISVTWPGSHKPERATPILGLYHGVLKDQFIFRHILGHLFPRKQNLHHVYERIRGIRYQTGKLDVMKRRKISFLGL